MDLVEDKPPSPMVAQKDLRILEEAADAGELAVVVTDVGKRLTEHGLAGPAHAHQPHDGATAPRVLDATQPEGACHHAISFAFG